MVKIYGTQLLGRRVSSKPWGDFIINNILCTAASIIYMPLSEEYVINPMYGFAEGITISSVVALVGGWGEGDFACRSYFT